MNAPTLSPEQEEAVVRKWAQEQLKDSRLLHLPRELACLVAMYASDATLTEHHSHPYERAKEILWRGEGATYHMCKCGDVVVGNDYLYNGTLCDFPNCEDAWACTACAQECQICRVAECTDHRDMIYGFAPMYTCNVCMYVRCVSCYNDSRRILCNNCGRDLCSNCVSPNYVNVCGKGYGCMARS